LTPPYLFIAFNLQDFLNTTCEEILHLNAQKLDSYRGNYDTFKQLENKKREQAQKAWELEQKRIKQLKAGGTTKAKANQQVLSKKTKEQAGAKKKKDDAIASGADSADIRVRQVAIAQVVP
jgi:ATP-binding cassette subfamily F protein 1